MEVTRTVDGGLFISQSLYIKDVLEKFKEYLPAKGSKFNYAGRFGYTSRGQLS